MCTVSQVLNKHGLYIGDTEYGAQYNLCSGSMYGVHKEGDKFGVRVGLRQDIAEYLRRNKLIYLTTWRGVVIP